MMVHIDEMFLIGRLQASSGADTESEELLLILADVEEAILSTKV